MLDVETTIGGDTGALVGAGAHPSGDVRLRTVRLPIQPDVAGAQALEPGTHAACEPRVTPLGGVDPRDVSQRAARLAHDRAPGPVCAQPVIPLRIHQAPPCRCHRRLPWNALDCVSGVKHLPHRPRRAHHAGLGQIRQRIGQCFRVGVVIAIGWSLHAEWIFDTLLRLVGADDPGPRVVIVLALGGVTHLRAAAHLGHTEPRYRVSRLSRGGRCGRLQ